MMTLRQQGKTVRGSEKIEDAIEMPNLVDVQLESYRWFLEEGLRELFQNFSQIEDYTGNLSLEFLDYEVGEPAESVEHCREYDKTYEVPIKAKVRLVNKETGEIKESEVYMGEIPCMTEKGTFLINGAERAVISQLARSPGVYFRDTIDVSGRTLHSAQIIPNEGAWVELDVDRESVISVKIGQTRKFPVTTLLRALDYFDESSGPSRTPCSTNPQILSLFGVQGVIHKPTAAELEGAVALQDVKDTSSEKTLAEALKPISHQAALAIEDAKLSHLEIIRTGMTVTLESPSAADVQGAFAAEDIRRSPSGKVIVKALHRIDADKAASIEKARLAKVKVLWPQPHIIETLAHDPATTAEEGLHSIYRRMRPGDPPTTEGAESLLRSIFLDVKRYDLGRVGRYKLNRKLGIDVPSDKRTLTKKDLIGIVRYLLELEHGIGSVDDIDHLQNKRVRAVGELLQDQLRIGFLRMERVARERMTSLEPEKVVAGAVISIKPITAAVKSFFWSGQLSQFMDQINPLAELAHKRRLSALGPGGLSRQSAKLEVRDVHHSHYGRICPIETPEGPNIGLIGYLSVHAKLDEYGFIQTPYRKVVDGRVTGEVEYLTADEEEGANIAPAGTPTDETGRLLDDRIIVRRGASFPTVPPEDVDYMDVSAKQVFSVATSLIPFLENDDPIRGLMGSNMQRQAVPLLRTEAPLVQTGMEERVARDSGALLLSPVDGIVEEATAQQVVVRAPDGERHVMKLQNFVRTNMGTCINQRRVVRAGDKVRKGDLLADGPSTANGSLALGRNLLVAFLPWEGYNYEDAILISRRLVEEDVLTSIHIDSFDIEARDTKLGPEEITREVPNVGDEALKDLDEHGIIRPGARVRAEDILVGKVAPKGQSELTAEEKLVIAIFGKKAEEMRDVSLRLPHGESGIVVGTKVFSRYKYQCENCGKIHHFGISGQHEECDDCFGRLKRIPGDELQPGVNQMVRVYVAQKRKVMVGDKLSGRHGNKGVIAKILPREDMPFLADGTPVDIVLNPLGVPSRMNIGQILETHLGLAAHEFDTIYVEPIFEGASEDEVMALQRAVAAKQSKDALVRYAQCELNRFGPMVHIEDGFETIEEVRDAIAKQLKEYSKEQLTPLAEWLAVDPGAWDRATGKQKPVELILEAAERDALSLSRLDPESGKILLFDGRTGEPFNQPVTVGRMYMMKLLHLVEDKIHARSTGPYSLVTQQPLGGKAQFGGQRFGEMEVWALEAYGAAHNLQEILTIKSDDVTGRVKTYESIVKGENITEPGVPESFKILIRELRSLGLDVGVETEDGVPVELKDDDDDEGTGM